MRAVSGVSGVPRGRWAWAVSGVATAVLLTIPAARLVAHPGSGVQTAVPGPEVTFTVSQPADAVDISSDGGPVRVTAGAVSRVTVTEPGPAGTFGSSAPSVSSGRVTLAPPGPGDITVTVPRSTAVTVTSGGGPVWLSGLSGTLTVDSGGGLVSARDLTSQNATVATGGGPAALSYGTAPAALSVLTEGGPARIGLPGGPYALNASSDGGPEQVRVATDPAARHTLMVTTGGGPLVIGPPSAVPGQSGSGASSGAVPAKPAAPAAPAAPGSS